jgi:predicted transcriptional regulator
MAQVLSSADTQRNVFSIGFGTGIRHAKNLVYADAFRSAHHRYKIEENVRGPSPHSAPS